MTPRERFRLRRDFVYARRWLRDMTLCWEPIPSIVSIVKWRLEVGGVIAVAVDHGIMSFCHIDVDGVPVPNCYPAEEMAGWGGFNLTVIYATLHVKALVEKRAERSAEAMAE